MRHVLPFIALGLVGCLEEVGTEEEAAALDDGLALSFLDALSPGEAAAFARAEGGPHPFVLQTYLEEGDSVPDGVEVREAWNGTSVARTPDGRQLWLLTDGAPYVHFRVVGEVPEDARLLVALGLEHIDEAIALVRDGAIEAEMLSWNSHQEPWVLPLARAIDGAVAAPGLEDTVALRWLQTCPGVLEECLLYGEPEAVATARDPIEPTGGWFLHPRNAELTPPAGARFEEIARYRENGAMLVVEAAELEVTDHFDVPQSFHRAWLEAGGRRVHAFDFIGEPEISAIRAGVARDGDRLIAWYWRASELAASFSEHEAATLDRVGDPVTLEAEMYYEPVCGHGLESTRPMPVRIGDELAYAIWWGGRDVLLFDGRSSYGSEAIADVEVDEDEYYDEYATFAEDAPAVLRLAERAPVTAPTE